MLTAGVFVNLLSIVSQMQACFRDEDLPWKGRER